MARFIVVDATTSRILKEDTDRQGAGAHLNAYRNAVGDRDLQAELDALEPGGYVRTFPDRRGIYVRRVT